jgi:hypothetical protein
LISLDEYSMPTSNGGHIRYIVSSRFETMVLNDCYSRPPFVTSLVRKSCMTRCFETF